MRKIAIILCFSLIFGLFAGCSSEGSYVPTGNGLSDEEVVVESTETIPDQQSTGFTLAYDIDEGFNPYEATALDNRMIFSLVYQGLFTMTRDYRVEGILCGAYVVSADYCTHTFTLETATFSDGTPVTAADVVASLNAAKAGPVYSGRFAQIESITAVDDLTVQIITSTPYENLAMLLDIPVTKAGQVNASIPIGSGPYVLSTYADGYVLTRQSDWWSGAELVVDRGFIELEGYETETQIRDAFQFSDVGFTLTDPGSARYAQFRGDYELWDVDTGVFMYLVCNASSSVFSNNEVRAALAAAVDRSAILQECYNGFGQIASIPASPSSPFYSTSLANTVGCDTALLQQTLTEHAMAGSAVSLLVNKGDTVRVQAARMIARMLTECGLTVELKAYGESDYTEALLAGNFDLYLGQTRLSSTMDLTQFYATGGALRFGALADSAIYEMCLKALENSGNYYDLHRMVLEDGQLISILFRYNAFYAHRGLATDLEPARDNIFFYSLGKELSDIMTVDYGE